MIGLPSGTRVWLAAVVTDLRRGFDGLSALVQTKRKTDPLAGHLFVFRGDLIKLLWWDGHTPLGGAKINALDTIEINGLTRQPKIMVVLHG
jgi:transposase